MNIVNDCKNVNKYKYFSENYNKLIRDYNNLKIIFVNGLGCDDNLNIYIKKLFEKNPIKFARNKLYF